MGQKSPVRSFRQNFIILTINANKFLLLFIQTN